MTPAINIIMAFGLPVPVTIGLLLATVCLVPVLTSVTSILPSDSATDLTFQLSHRLPGEVVAFADFNSDGLLDALTLGYSSEVGKETVIVNLWRPDSSLPEEQTLLSTAQLEVAGIRCHIEGVSVADFNGDALADLLLSVRDQTGVMTVWVAYGKENSGKSIEHVAMVTEAIDQPTLLDYNSDLVADFIVETAKGKLALFTGIHNATRFAKHANDSIFPDLNISLHTPNGNLFADLTSDLRPDLLVRLESPGANFTLLTPSTQGDKAPFRQIEFNSPNTVIGNADTGLTYGPPEPFRAEESDAGIDLAMPACQIVTGQSVMCATASSELWIYSSAAKLWCRATISGLGTSYSWHPEHPALPVSSSTASRKPVLRVRASDLDLDGHPDLVALLRRHSDNLVLAGVLRWSGSHAVATAACPGFKMFADELPGVACGQQLPGVWRLTVVAPAEVDQDGSPDLLIVCRTGGADEGDSHSGVDKQQQNIRGETSVISLLFAQVHNQPGTFFRLQTMTSARCSGPSPQSCQRGRLSRGLPSPGPCAKFVTEPTEGGYRSEIGCQLAQPSAYGRLPLPGVHFGLGQVSNYLERVTVSVPFSGGGFVRQRDLLFIMPNSLLLVSPHPPDMPVNWRTWLILRPLEHPHVWGVGVALALTCALAGTIAGALQFQDWRQDKAERAVEGIVFDPHR